MAEWDYDDLCDHLRPVVELELRLGNMVKRVDAPAGSRCPLAVMFLDTLHRTEIERALRPSAPIGWLENSDPHYDLAGTAGYVCEEDRHFVYGPVPFSR
ncbi:MAG TPA: hypothetical protein VLS93_05830 [Anaeromyxobacteraceae bacterium]|nr:hypothetical protein [Anaeromyxobacteraceae bacterium]